MTSTVAPCVERATSIRPDARLVARRVRFDDIPRDAWDRLLAATPSATPFSRWTFHRAWWDGYGESAHEDYMVCVPADEPGHEAESPSERGPGDGADERGHGPEFAPHGPEPAPRDRAEPAAAESGVESAPRDRAEPGPESGVEPASRDRAEPGPESGVEPAPRDRAEPGPESGVGPGHGAESAAAESAADVSAADVSAAEPRRGRSAAAGSEAAARLRAETEADAPLDPDRIVAIVPLMHRHEVEPDDALFRTAIRHARHGAATTLPDRAKAVFFAASYHADYATILCDPADLPAVADATVEALAAGPNLAHGTDDWECIDLRRFRDDDPTLPALEQAFCAAADRYGWEVAREQEEVCPVLHVGEWDWETYLQTLSTKDRHELRRKMRRAEAAGPVEFEEVPDPSSAVDELIRLHQARWGDEGLFPDTEGGARSRRFFHRLAELEGPDGVFRIGRLTVGDRTIFMCVGFHDRATVYYYNAGSDPEAQALSPGVIGVASYLRHELAEGTRVFDFLRGDESYKYRWGAKDEPIHRLIVTRRARG